MKQFKKISRYYQVGIYLEYSILERFQDITRFVFIYNIVFQRDFKILLCWYLSRILYFREISRDYQVGIYLEYCILERFQDITRFVFIQNIIIQSNLRVFWTREGVQSSSNSNHRHPNLFCGKRAPQLVITVKFCFL